MKILIVGPTTSVENKLLVRAARQAGHTAKIISVLDTALLKKIALDYDMALIRGVVPHDRQTASVLKFLRHHKILIVDQILTDGWPGFNKLAMYQKLKRHHVAIPTTIHFGRQSDCNQKKLSRIGWPIVAKDIEGMHGRHVFILPDWPAAQNWLKNKPLPLRRFVWQKFIAGDYYYRVFMVGSQVIGGLRRFSLHYQSQHPGLSLSDRAHKTILPKNVTDLARHAHQVMGFDISGVDIMVDQAGQAVVLEVNRCPKFKRLTAVTKIDVAGQIINYLHRLYAKKK